MTEAQFAALEVLAAVPVGQTVDSWTRASRIGPRPRVNIRAADNLVKKGLAAHQLSMAAVPYRYEYRLTPAGERAYDGECRRRARAAA